MLSAFGVIQPVQSWRRTHSTGVFLLFHLTTANNSKLTCVVAFINGQLRAPAERITTTLIIQDYSPSLIVNIGISGGLKDAKLGMVLADSIDDFTAYGALEGDTEEKEWDTQLGGIHYAPSLALRTAAGYLEVSHPEVFDVFRRAAADAKRECLGAIE